MNFSCTVPQNLSPNYRAPIFCLVRQKKSYTNCHSPSSIIFPTISPHLYTSTSFLSTTMAASVQYKQQERTLGMVMKAVDDDLALFLEMRNREKQYDNDDLMQNSDELDDSLGSELDSSSLSKETSTMPTYKPSADDFLNSENDKADYDWLLAPPGTHLFSSLEMEAKKTVMSPTGISDACPTALNLMPENNNAKPASRSNVICRQPTLSNSVNSSNAGNRRASSGGPTSTASRPASRSATPTERSTLPVSSKPSRPSKPTSTETLPSTKPTARPVRSLTPTRATARSSTPTARPSIVSKSAPRFATPPRRPSTPSSMPSISVPSGRSCSVTKSGPTLKNSLLARGASPTVKSRPQKPSEMSHFLRDVPSNSRTSMPQRPVSASRGRPSAPRSRSSSTETNSGGRSNRQSCSPLGVRAINGNACKSGSSMLTRTRGHSNGSDDVNPVLIGTKMVERVVNMRKLAPPKQEDHLSKYNNPPGKSSSSKGNSGFGRSLSKKSLDMALRHMDIRGIIPNNLSSLATNIPASSLCSLRSSYTKSRTVGASDSPLAKSSDASSELGINNNSHCSYWSRGRDSEREHSSPASQRE